MKSADEQKYSVPFNRSYWVVPDKLLAGCYPGAVGPKQAHQKLKGLLEHGIRRVISLIEPTETNWNGKAFESYEDGMKSIANDMGGEVFFDRMPIKDTWIPSRKEMCQILPCRYKSSGYPRSKAFKGEAVVFYCESLATQEMGYPGLSLWVKNMTFFSLF
ncbi:MAG: hypothetical protein JW902_07800 [Syntrophaceae bacterium]|nr:hypothetical protein [Syntrophaceae bacterium]